MSRARSFAAGLLCLGALAGCSGDGAPALDAASDGATTPDAAPCVTRITYGSSWIKPAGHPAMHACSGRGLAPDAGRPLVALAASAL